jgi:hypothetical protein
MNRERQLTGPNSYERDLGLDIPKFLRLCDTRSGINWVDLCCGSGRALIAAAAEFLGDVALEGLRIEGVDLAGLFDANPYPHLVTLRKQSIETWTPVGPYTLMTCVHGLHYVGDKLAAIAKVVVALQPKGLFVANLDLANFRDVNGGPAGRKVAARLRASGLQYDTRRRLLQCTGPRAVNFGLRYLGADDRAGPNYTGQEAVDSYYEV